VNGGDGAAGSDGANGVDGVNGVNGADGINGVDGADGRGITSIVCATDAAAATYFRFTFTDGTATDIAGPCTLTSEEN